jgi:hypothetical protein
MIDEIVDSHQVTLIVTVCELMSFGKAMMACWSPFETFKFRGNPQIA